MTIDFKICLRLIAKEIGPLQRLILTCLTDPSALEKEHLVRATGLSRRQARIGLVVQIPKAETF